jgi:deoxyribonuclease V
LRPLVEHPWNLCEAEALELQAHLAARVIINDDLPAAIRSIAGVDAAYQENSDCAFAAVAVLEAHTRKVLDLATASGRTAVPYTPGLLSFRELPVISLALENLRAKPDLIVCDGQGIAHPRRFGLACHLGVLYDIPTIGCAKTRLFGDAAKPGPERGQSTKLVAGAETVGVLLRTQTRVRAVYVSPGHRVSIETAAAIVLSMCARYRLPEPIRIADQAVNSLKRMGRELRQRI